MSKKEIKLKEFIWQIKKGKNAFKYKIYLENTKEEMRILEEFCSAGLNKKKYLAWAVIIDAIADYFGLNNATSFFTEKTLNYLIENKIDINTLAHLNLDDDWLIKIYEADKESYEALLTVGERYLCDKEDEKFADLINKYPDENFYNYLLIKIYTINKLTENVLKKSELLIEAIIEHYAERREILKLAGQASRYFELRETKDIQKIINTYYEGEALYLLAISFNDSCPIEIIKRIAEEREEDYSEDAEKEYYIEVASQNCLLRLKE